MSTTKKIIFRKDPRNPKYGYLKLQTITNRKAKEKSIKIKILKSNWNPEKQFVYSTEPNADKINQKIQDVLREENGKLSKKVKEDSLIDFAENIITLIPVKSTRDSKKYALKKLNEFLESEGKTDLLFPEVDLYFIRRYYNFLNEEKNGKKPKVSSANEYMTNFRYFINQADIHDKYTYPKDPFRKFKRKRSDRTHKVMTPSEQKAFFNYEPIDESYLHVQCGFGFMMHAAGMRIIDLLNLKWENFKKEKDNYHLEYHMQKTDKLMTPKLTVEALEFLTPFIEEYEKEGTTWYNLYKKKNEELVKTLEEYIEEESQIELVTLGSFKFDLQTLDGFDRIHKIMQEEEKKEKRKRYLQHQIPQLRASIEFNRKQLIGILGDAILKIKELYPTDNVLPHCRNVPQRMLARVQHAVKIQFNYRLKMIAKEAGIKTHITNHQARHVFAQRLFEAGVNFHHISLALGHKTLETTENYRNKLITDKAMDVVEEFSRIKSF